MRKPVFAICKQQRRSLISAFVVCCQDSTILAKSKTSRLWLASEAVQAGLSLTWSHTVHLEDRFSRDEAQISTSLMSSFTKLMLKESTRQEHEKKAKGNK